MLVVIFLVSANEVPSGMRIDLCRSQGMHVKRRDLFSMIMSGFVCVNCNIDALLIWPENCEQKSRTIKRGWRGRRGDYIRIDIDGLRSGYEIVYISAVSRRLHQVASRGVRLVPDHHHPTLSSILLSS